MGRIGVAPVFSKQAQLVAQNTSAFGFTYDHVHLVIRGTPDTTVVVKDTTVEFTPSSSELPLDVTVPIVIDGQKFDVSLDYTSSAVGALFHGSTIVASYRPGRTPPPQQDITLEYVGPGAAVARLAITPDTTTVIGTASASLTVTAFDDKDAQIAVPPLLWSTSDAGVVDVVGTGDKVTAQGKGIRGTAAISVISPSGAADTSDITVGLPAASIVVVSGAGQAGAVHTQLAEPAVVQVNAVDDIGVPGVSVLFAAPTGGAVSTTTAVTDANGRASMTMTLGTAAGPQAFVASTGNFSTSIAATASAGVAAATSILAGANQIDTIGKLLTPLSVRIVDAFSNPVPNVAVSWTRVRGTGTLGSATSTTTAEGIAVNTYTLGTTAGADSVAVTSGSATTGFSFTTKAGTAAAIAIVSGTTQTASVGAALAPFVVKVTDAGGNPVANATVTWSAVNGTLTSSTTTTGADGQTSTAMTLGAVGAASATASIGSDKSVVFSATAIGSGSARLLLIPASPTSFTKQAGAALTSMPSIQVVDANGVGIANAPVHVRTTQSDTTVGPEVDLTAGADGKILAPDAADINTAGTYTVTATSSAAPGSTLSVTLVVTAGAPAQLGFVSPNGTTSHEAGAVITPPVTVAVRDFYGNLVATATNQVTVALSNPNGATLLGTRTVSAVNGVATFSDLSIDLVHDLYRLSATSGTLTAATSLPINIVAPGTMHLAFAGVANGVAGVAVPAISVEARDVHDQLITSATPTVTLAVVSGPGSIGGVTTATAVGGKATFAGVVFTKSGTYTLSATAGDAVSGTSAPFTVAAGAAAKLSKIVGDNQSAPVNTAVAIAPKVLVTDANDNPVPQAVVRLDIVDGGGSYHLSGGDGTATSGPANTDANGFLTLDAWTLGSIATTNTLRARLTDADVEVLFTAIATSGVVSTPTALALVSGNTQNGTVGTALAQPFVVKATDVNGNPVAGVQVAWAGTNGSLAGTTVTGTDGTTSNRMTLGQTPGAASATATVTGLTPVAFSAVALVGPPSQFAFTTPPANTTAGAPFAVAVALRDQFGNATASSAAVTIALGSNPGGATLSGTKTINAVGGTATFSNLSIDKVGAGYTLSAAAAGIPAATSGTFNVSAGAATQLAIEAGDNGSGVRGTASQPAPSVRVTDAGGNPVSGAVVTFAATSGGSTTPANGQVMSDASGIATLGTWTLSNTVGAQTLTAGIAAGASVTFHSTASSGPANAIGKALPVHGVSDNGDNQSGAAGTVLPKPFIVHVTDGSNPVEGAVVTWTATDGTIAATSTTDVNGLSSNTMTLGGTLGASAAAAQAQVGGNSVTFHATVNAGAPAQLEVTAQPTNTTSGATLSPVSFRLRDQFGNPTTGTNAVTIALTTPGGAALGGTPTRNAVSGTVTFNDLTVDKANTYTLTASGAGLTSAVTNSFVISAGTASRIAAVAGDNLSGLVSQPTSTPPTVLVTDDAGNPVSGASVTFSVQTGGGSISPAGPVSTDQNGFAAPSAWTLGAAAGDNTVKAALAGGASVVFTAHGASGTAAAIVAQSGGGETAAVGTAVTPFVVKVTDANNNPVEGATVNWALTNASAASATTHTGSDGTSSYAMTLGHTAGAASATASVAGVATGATFTATATAGPAAQLVFTVQPSNATSASAIIPAVVVALRDQYGNATAATNNVTMAIGTNPSTGSLSGTRTVAAVNGSATFSNLSIDKAGTGYTLSATSAGLTGTTSTAFNVGAGAAANLAIAGGDNVAAVINTATSPAPSVLVTDAAGNPVSGVTVTFTADGARGSTMPANGQVQSGVNGIATLGAWTMSGTAGAHTLTATLDSRSVTFHATASTAAASVIDILSGNGQTDTAGTVADAPLVVRVRDGSGNLVAGAVVSWTVTNGKVNGSTGTVTTVTGATGQASVALTLSETAGTGATSATATLGNGATALFSATAVAGAPTQLAITAQPPASVTAAATISAITVGLRDAFGNPATGTNSVAIAFGNNPGGGLLGGTKTQNAVGGTAIFNDLSIAKSGAAYTLVASATGLTSATTNAFTVVAGAAAGLAIVQGDNGGGVAGSTSSPAPQVRVTDAYGNNVVGASVTYSVVSGGGSVTPADGIVTSNGSGVAALGAWKLGPTIGTNTLEAHLTANASVAVNFTATGTSGGAANIAISSGNDQSATVQQSLAAPFVVKVTDANGNAVSGALVTWTVNGGTLSSSSTTTDANGLASTTMTLGVVAGGVSATATAPGGAQVTFTGTAHPGGAAELTYTTGPATTVAGATMPSVVVAVRDAFNNLVTTSAASVTVAIGNNPATGTLSGTTTRNAVNGIATFTDLSIDRSGTGYTLIASAISLQPATSDAFNISVGAPAHIDIVEGDNLTAVVNQATATPPKVRITDANGNLVPSANVTFAVKTGGGTIKLTSSGSAVTTGTLATDAAGLATLDSWILGSTIGGNTLEARVSPSLAVTFTATGANGAPSSIAITAGNNQSDTVATTLATQLEVIVRDVNGNPVTGATVTWTSTNGSVTGTTTTGSDGQTTNTLTLGTTAGAASVTAKITNGQQQVFSATVQPGAAKRLEFTSQPFHTTAGVVLPTINAMLRDQFGNATPSATNAVTLALGTNPTSANLAGTTTRNAVNGAVQFDDIAVGAAGAGFRLSVTAAGVDSAVSNAFSVSSNVVSTVSAESGGGQSATVNTNAAAPLVVRVADASDANIVAANITWASRHGTVLSASESSTDSTGRTSITIKYSTVAGTDTITATSINGKVAEFVVTAVPDVAVKLGFLVPGGTGSYNASPSNPITNPTTLQVAVQDQYGNTVTTSTASIGLTLDSPNGAVVSNGTSRAATAGVVVFDQASINKVGVYTVYAVSSGFANVPSLPISVTFGGGQH